MKVLSIDGGGIRGIIPAMILAEIERRTGKRIWEMFDLIAGTSTGGLLALGLVAPKYQEQEVDYLLTQPLKKIEQIIDVYREQGREIFWEPLIESVTRVDDLVKPKYSSDGRKGVINKMLGHTPLDRALTNILIPAYDIESRMPVFFVNNAEIKPTKTFEKRCVGFSMAEAAMATSAAPTFFEPYQAGEHAFVDGSVFANNPSMFAIAEALTLSKTSEQSSDITLVSLGTGNLTRKYPYAKAKDWGLLGWLDPLINIMMDGMSKSVEIKLEYLMRPTHYYRFQAPLTEANDDMDDASSANVQLLEELAKSIILEKDQELDELCHQLNH